MLLIIEKFKEVIFSILPIFIITIILAVTLAPLDMDLILKFILGTLLMLIGMPLFLFGIDISITSIGEQISKVLVKSNRLWIILLGGCFLGFIVTVAEPDLHILATQVTAVTSGRFNSNLMILLVSLGVGLMVTVALLRILKNFRLNRLMMVVYLVILALGIFTQPDFLAIAFDASGSTTGSISVPFILAIAVAMSAMTRRNETEDHDGFGMLGIASTGAIIAVMLQGIFTGTEVLDGRLPIPEIIGGSVFNTTLSAIMQCAVETFTVILPIIIIYLVMNFIWIKAPAHKLKRIMIGCIYTYVGLVLFLAGVNAGFIEASRQIGYQISAFGQPWLLILVGMLFGIITIPAEPSVHVLTRQIEDETAGSIKSLAVIIILCIGVAAAVGLSMLRILIPELQLWNILLPGMAIAIILSFIVPNIFVGIAYDSGGVAAGTMTAAFILPFAQGAAEYIPGASVVQDGFGLIALVAMTPLIALQLLGLVYKVKTKRLLTSAGNLAKDMGDAEND